jgi:hypothetical protein
VKLPRAAVLALAAACAPAPRPAPLHNLAAEAGPEPTGARCPPPAPSRIAPSSPSLGAVAGTVIDEHCELIPGATVMMTGERAAGPRVEITDERGRFSFDDLEPDRYVISVYYLDSTLERGGVRIHAGVVEQVRLAMPPPARAEPRITRDAAAP